jgi:DNA modification methylase
MNGVDNPKRRGAESAPSTWYPYYAGFSESFAESVLSTTGVSEGDWVLDPWNGSGTTTAKAASLGLNACGYDLNPVMVVVAKARSLDAAEYSSLKPLSIAISRKARKRFDICADDPLLEWLLPHSVAEIRAVEAAIQTLLVDDKQYLDVRTRGTDTISDLAAFFYVALFRTLRRILTPFRTSNPTWLKQPVSRYARLRPSGDTIRAAYKAEVTKILPQSMIGQQGLRGKRILQVASSEKLPLTEASVDIVLASPPYCTRIDYAVATSVELSLLGFVRDAEFRDLRRGLIGTTTVPKVAPGISKDWGGTCLSFLERLKSHSSKASATYYYKNHLQYFQSISASLSEIGRVLKLGGKSVIAVQDSYYKDLHNNLPLIFAEMALFRGLDLQEKYDFPLSRTMAGVNPSANGYRASSGAIESVLILKKVPIMRKADR